MESPELRPLPPLNTQQGFTQNFRSRDDESEEFYSPKGSINGKDSSIGTRSDSPSAFAAIEVENFNGSTSNSSSTYSSSIPRSGTDSGSDPGSPVRSANNPQSPPKSPGLIEIQALGPLLPQMPSPRDLLLQESASLSSSSPERYSESSPRIWIVSYQMAESPPRICGSLIPTSRGLVFPETNPASQSSERYSESSPRISNASNQSVRSPVSSSSFQHNSFAVPEMQGLVFEESASTQSKTSDELSPRNSNVEYPAESSSSPGAHPTDSSNAGLMCLESGSPLLPNSSESSPRISTVDSFMRIRSPVEHKLPLPMSSLLLENYSTSEEWLPRTSDASDQNVEPPQGIISHVQHIDTPPSLDIPFPQPSEPFPPPPVSVPPPPPPPTKVWESPRTPTPIVKKPVEPPALRKPLRPIVVECPDSVSPIELPSNDSETVKTDWNNESRNKETEYSSADVERNEESTLKPKLKPLHWDKVRASSEREMVWDQLKCSSFKVDEEMIETLFIVNTPKPNLKEATRWQVLPSPGQDHGDRVLDPKKAQNIAILFKAIHVTVDEVCEGLMEGNADVLGAELLESLLRMAPSKEEERKLKEYKEDSPIKLGAAERFLKAVVDIPYAFKRVDAMLYISNFESEVEYLKKSFATLEAACEELRTNRMFLKLLEAVLKTGNRMNVGTNRGDAHAFKLDTLLKLVDIKGADGKTTLLHFVVQEIIRSEGARLSGGDPHENPSTNDDAKCRKLGLQVVSDLSTELSSVKKAAAMDAEVLSSDVSKLSKGIGNIKEIVTLIEAMPLEVSGGHKFSNSMNSFMENTEEEIFRIQAQENVALSLVKEITEYFHGNSVKEEAHPFRIFMVVRDFLTVLDRVCREVGMINERTIVSSAHKFPVPVNPMMQQVSGVSQKRQYTSSSDDESFPLNV